MIVSKETLINVIEDLHRGDYTIKDLATDYSGCYQFITQPDGNTGHVAVYDDACSGTTPPVHRKIITVQCIKIFVADSGYDYYDPDIMIVNEEPDFDESWESTDGQCNIELLDENSATLSDEQKNKVLNLINDFDCADDYEDDIEASDLVSLLISIIKEKFCVYDTWDDVPDDCLDDDAVDIEDCTLIQDLNLGVIKTAGICYYVVDTYPELTDDACEFKEENDRENLSFVYAVPETSAINEYGIYDELYLIGYLGKLNSPEVVYTEVIESMCYNSVDESVDDV